MKKKILTILGVIAICLFVMPACKMDTASFAKSSIKTISKPYIAQYECVEARFGEDDFLEYYDYIKVILHNKSKIELLYKLKDGESKSVIGSYMLDPETRKIEAEIGILGYKFKEKVIVEKGEFVISHTIMQKEFFMKFQTK